MILLMFKNVNEELEVTPSSPRSGKNKHNSKKRAHEMKNQSESEETDVGTEMARTMK